MTTYELIAKQQLEIEKLIEIVAEHKANYDQVMNKLNINSEVIMKNEFYLQDSRSYAGNDILWWAKEGWGYTTDLSKADVFTKEEALRLNKRRRTDMPWPKEYIDAKARPAVDMQYVDTNFITR